jgi:hypothetical protein
MVYTLTNEEKISIIEQHLKNLEYNRYNLEISMIEITSATSPKEESVENLQAEIDSIASQQAALAAELASLS